MIAPLAELLFDLLQRQLEFTIVRTAASRGHTVSLLCRLVVSRTVVHMYINHSRKKSMAPSPGGH
jgi:hypothetical protein